jgi:hypothetical protein
VLTIAWDDEQQPSRRSTLRFLSMASSSLPAGVSALKSTVLG